MQRKLLAAVVGLSLVVAACGDDANDSTGGPARAAAPVEEPSDSPADEPAEDPADEVADEPAAAPSDEAAEDTTDEPAPDTTDEPAEEAVFPSAIISLSPAATEMLYAIGAGDQVLAVDDFSNYPPETADKMQGLSGFQPNVEAIAGLEPDLVITDGTNPDLLGQLDTLGIPHWEGMAAMTFDDVFAQIQELGAVTGHEDAAAELVAEMAASIEEVKASLPVLDEPLTYYHELDPTFFSVTSDTFIGAVYAEVGLVNIADAVGDGNPYPQLSQEFIVAEDPDLVFLACTIYCGETAESVAARPGWDVLSAVQGDGVIEMNDDIASRWGPRIVEYLEAVGDAVAAVTAG